MKILNITSDYRDETISKMTTLPSLSDLNSVHDHNRKQLTGNDYKLQRLHKFGQNRQNRLLQVKSITCGFCMKLNKNTNCTSPDITDHPNNITMQCISDYEDPFWLIGGTCI